MNNINQANNQNPFDIKALISAIILRRYVFVGVMLAIVTASVIYSYSVKKMYKAETVVVVDAPSVANPLAERPSGSKRAQDRLSLIKQLLFNRSSVARVIRELDLDVYIKNPYQYEALIEKIQSNLHIRTRRNNLFQLSYIGEDPKQVRDIVNTLASQYIEDSFQSKRSGSSISTDFYNDQILYYREHLDDAENAVKVYLEENPEMALRRPDVKLVRIQSMQTSLMEIRLQRKELQSRLDILNDQLSGKAPLTGTITDDDSPIGRLEKLEDYLTVLLLKYTANYPEVLKVKGQIDELKKGLDSASDASKSKDSSNPVLKQVKGEATKIMTELAMLTSREDEIEKEILNLEASLKEAPGEQKELLNLKRNVNVYERLYNTLISKFEEMKITKALEQREEPFIFKVVSPAVLPVRPVTPDRVMIIILGLFAGIGAGVALVFAWENYFDTSFKNVDSLKNSINIPVLAAIPNIVTDEVKKKKRKRDIWVFSATAVYLVVVGLILLFELASKYGLEVL